MSWLKNRWGEKWRDKQDVEHSGPEGKPLFMSDAALAKIATGKD